MTRAETEIYAEILSFLAIYVVELSTNENKDLLKRDVLSPNIKNYIIRNSGFSSQDFITDALREVDLVSRARCLYDAKEIRKKLILGPRPSCISLEELLDAFVDICGSYGPCIELATTKHFQIQPGYRTLFKSFEKHKYAELSAKGYLWTDKIALAMIKNSIWQAYSLKIQRQLETESQADKNQRLHLMYNSLPTNIREYLRNDRYEHEMTDKLLDNWNWRENKWGKSDEKTVTWIVYRYYVQGLQKLIANS